MQLHDFFYAPSFHFPSIMQCQMKQSASAKEITSMAITCLSIQAHFQETVDTCAHGMRNEMTAGKQ
jgi:hypothetical protein